MALQGFRIEGDSCFACNGIGLRQMLQAGKTWLGVHVEIVNNLNVFPVPDGDTGINMMLTIRAAVSVLDQMQAEESVSTVMLAAAQGALLGARGNSGVILSQFLQGLATGLAGESELTAINFVAALRSGVELAYQSVTQPVEGTILSVMKASWQAGQLRIKLDQDLIGLLTGVVDAAKIAQAKTPEQLPILKEVGVTDSGGQGFVYILEGMLRFVTGQSVEVAMDAEPLIRPKFPQRGQVGRLPDPKIEYRYDVQFLIHGDNLDVDAIRREVERLGRSTLVVGGRQTVKVHVHTKDPGVPLSYGVTQGSISDVVVENMQKQVARFGQTDQFAQRTTSSQLPKFEQPPGVDQPLKFERAPTMAIPQFGTSTNKGYSEQKPPNLREGVGVIAIVPGEGFRQIFQGLGVNLVLLGGQTFTLSVQELLTAINQVGMRDIVILPNNGNLILAAQQVRGMSGQQIEIIPTKTVPQGVAALLRYDSQAALKTNVERMTKAIVGVQTIEITHAVQDIVFDGFEIREGDVIGLLNSKIVAVGNAYDVVITDILSQQALNDFELATFYFGQGISDDQAEAIGHKVRAFSPDLEVEVYGGGQAHYQYIISLE